MREAERSAGMVSRHMRALVLVLVLGSACAADTGALDPSEVPSTPRVELALVDEPSVYQTLGAVGGAPVRLALAFPGCPYAWPYPVWLHNTGNQPLEGGVDLEGPLALLAPAPSRLAPGERVLLSVVVQGAPVHEAEAALVARYHHEETEVTARRAFTARIVDDAIVERFTVPQLPWHHEVLVIDGSPETARHADALDASLRNLHASAQGEVRLRWTIAVGSPGDALLLDLGAGPVLEHPQDVDVVLAAARRALGSGRSGDVLGATVQALDTLGPLDAATWGVRLFSAVDSLPTDLAALDARGGALVFQVGGARCGGPPTPVLDAAAMVFGDGMTQVCEPLLTPSTPLFPRHELSLSRSPQPDSLRVEIDGVELPAHASHGPLNWWWEASTTHLRLAPFAWPEPGSTVVVRYREACFPSVDDFDWR